MVPLMTIILIVQLVCHVPMLMLTSSLSVALWICCSCSTVFRISYTCILMSVRSRCSVDLPITEKKCGYASVSILKVDHLQ
jgi:hypothetical protein